MSATVAGSLFEETVRRHRELKFTALPDEIVELYPQSDVVRRWVDLHVGSRMTQERMMLGLFKELVQRLEIAKNNLRVMTEATGGPR